MKPLIYQFVKIVFVIFTFSFFCFSEITQESEVETENFSNLWSRDSIIKAIELLSQKNKKNQTDNKLILQSQMEIGRLFLILGEKKKASDNFLNAFKFSKTVGNFDFQVISLSELSLLALEDGKFNQSEKYFTEAEKITTESLAAKASLNLSKGEFYYYQRNLDEAIKYYKKAVELSQTDQNDKYTSVYLLHLGYAYLDNDEPQKSLEILKSAFDKAQQIHNTRISAFIYIAIGHVSNYLGNKQAALEAYKKAEILFPDDVDFIEKARLFSGIGYVYEDYRDWKTSFDYRLKAIELFRKANHRIGELAILPYLAMLSDQLGNEKNVLDYFDQAQSLAEKLHDNYQSSINNEELGNFYFQKGNFGKALFYYSKSLNFFNKNSKREISLIKAKLAQIYSRQNQISLAFQNLTTALELNREIKNRFGEVECLYQLAILFLKNNNSDKALSYLEQSIYQTENLSSSVFNSKLQQNYFSNAIDRYELYINLLMKMGQQLQNDSYMNRALQASEKSRARLMIETLQLSEANFIKDSDPELIKREKETRTFLNLKTDKLTDLLSNNADKVDIAKLDSEINELNNQLEEIKGTLKQNSPLYSSIKNPPPFDVNEFQNKVLDENTLLLEFSFGKDESYLWCVGKNEVSSFTLSAREALETRIEKLRELLSNRSIKPDETVEEYQARLAGAADSYWLEAQKLSNELFGQIADKLSNKRLIIVADGKLHYFPVSALPLPNSDKNEPMLLTNEIIYEPSASTLNLIVNNPNPKISPDKNLLVFADPIYAKDDSRLKDIPIVETKENKDLPAVSNLRFADSLSNLQRLMASEEEAASIAEVLGSPKSDVLTGFSANRERIFAPEISDYKILHFATHGLIYEDRPELSSLVLSQFDENGQNLDGLLRLQDIYSLNLSSDLVVLSACDTGIGKEVKGEGLMSLNNAFLQVGAKSVLSSLWKVDDQATKELMKIFYQELATKKYTTSESLRQAQIKMFNNPQFRAPFYWAAFTIQGDYQNIPKLSNHSNYRLYLILFIPLLLVGSYFGYKKFFQK